MATTRKTTTKTPTAKKAPRKRRAKAKTSQSLAPATYGGLPAPLNNVKYVRRTLEILEQRERRAARLRADTKRELAGVFEELRIDVSDRFDGERAAAEARIERLMKRARKTEAGRVIGRIPTRVTKTFDGWLDRVGLVRKAALA